MFGRRWAALPVIVGVLTGNVALAAADVSPATPVPTPSPTPEPPTAPTTSETGPGGYVTTVTTTTTIVNAPITVIAAPVTTTINRIRNGPGGAGWTPVGARERFVINLTGCGEGGPRSLPGRARVRRANVRLGRNASLVVRVNGRRVTALRLPAGQRRRGRGVALRLRLAPNGTLTIRRPSGRVMAVQGCAPV
jgi:hypothetical protein